MPKRPTRAAQESADSRQKKQKSQQKQGSFWKRAVAVMGSERFRFAVGFVMACFVLYAIVSYISYFFSGAQDYSALGSELTGKELKAAILNKGGVIGARMQDFFVDRTFGIPVFSAIIFLALWALRLMRVRGISLWKTFLHCFFWLVWGSLALSFVQYICKAETFFRWGGAQGEFFCSLLVNNIEWVGTLLVVLAVLIVYLVGISHRTIPAFQTAGLWLKNLLQRKPKEQKEEEIIDLDADTPKEVVFTMDGEEASVLDLTPAAEETEEPKKPAAAPDLSFTITDTLQEQPAEAQQEEESIQIIDDDDEDDPEMVDPELADSETEAPVDQVGGLDITETEATEMAEYNSEAVLRKLGPFDPRADLSNYKFPALDLLKVYDNENAPIINQEEQYQNANRIVSTLRNYGVEIDSIKATVGPTVTLYEVVPKAGVRIAKIQSLESDIMMSLSAVGIRIIAPMPGKGTVGIEVPNEKAQVVSMHSVVASKRFQDEQKMKLPIALGKTITNEIFMFDLAKTPHLLVAGATGQGKSVAINAIITSLLYKKHPAELKMVLVDPKMVEFAPYKPLLKHFLAAQPDTEEKDVIITDCSKVIDTLNSLVIEMENRYTLLMDAGVRNLEDYNEKFIQRRLNPAKLVNGALHHQFLPYIVIVIDEYGDFIMQAGKQVEQPIARITQKARAVGMHMILATQRPSVNIVTGVIKANIPTRIALRTQSVVDSRTVLDAKGADQLIGRGDLLYSGGGNITRVQCAFVDTPEVDKIVEHVEKQQHYSGPYELPEYVGGEGGGGEELAPGSVDLKKLDPMFAEVARYVVNNQQGSTSVLQRRFEIGYNRAGKLTDQLEAAGIVGPNKGSKGREVLIQDEMALREIFSQLGLM